MHGDAADGGCNRLADHLATYAELGPDGLVSPAERRGPLRRSSFNRRTWIPATRAVGVEGLRFHCPASYRRDAGDRGQGRAPGS
jgi:hypothetical protein